MLLVGSDAPLKEQAGRVWTSGHAGMAWDEMIQRTCREHGGFEPDIRHRTNDANVILAVTRATDAARPSINALLDALQT